MFHVRPYDHVNAPYTIIGESCWISFMCQLKKVDFNYACFSQIFAEINAIGLN